MGYTKTMLKFSARKIFTKIMFLSLQNVGWTGFHYSRKGEYTSASIDVAPYGEVYAPKLTSPPPEGYDTSVAFAMVTSGFMDEFLLVIWTRSDRRTV